MISHSIPITTKHGNQYFLQFSEFNSSDFSIEDSKHEVFDVALVVESNEETNCLSDFREIANACYVFMSERDAILYCYCSQETSLLQRQTRELLPQEFRYRLFTRLIKRFNSNNDRDKIIHKRESRFDDPEYGKHYIILLGNKNNVGTLDDLHEQVNLLLTGGK